MSTNQVESNVRPDTDPELVAMADYMCDYEVTSEEALDTARNNLMDRIHQNGNNTIKKVYHKLI